VIHVSCNGPRELDDSLYTVQLNAEIKRLAVSVNTAKSEINVLNHHVIVICRSDDTSYPWLTHRCWRMILFAELSTPVGLDSISYLTVLPSGRTYARPGQCAPIARRSHAPMFQS
jgi:hypothetical protein